MIRLRDVRWLELFIVLLTPLTIGALSACNAAHIATDPGTSTELSEAGSKGSWGGWLGIAGDKSSNVNQLREFPPYSTLAKTSSVKNEIALISFLEGGNILSVAKDGRALIWDRSRWRNGELVEARLLFDRQAPITAAAAFPEQALVATAAADGIQLTRGGAPWKTLSKLKARIWSLAFEPNGNSLIIGGSDGLVYRWNYTFSPSSSRDEEKELERYVGHSGSVTSVVYHPQGRLFFSGDWQGILSAWLQYGSDAYGGNYDENLFGRRFFGEASTRRNASRNNRESIEHITISPDGRLMAVGCNNGGVELVSVRGFNSVAWVAGAHKGMVLDLAFSADGKTLFSLGRDDSVKRWTISPAEEEGKYQLVANATAAVSLPRVLVPDSRDRALVGTAEGKILEPKWSALPQ